MPFRTISVAVTTEAAGAINGLRQTESAVNRFESATRQSSTRVNQSTRQMASGFSNLESIIGRGVTRSLTGFVAATVGGYAAGRALNAALRDIVGGAVQFQARMLNVNSISHLTGAQLDQLSNQVLDLSKQLPQSANTLAEGLYDIASSGFQGAAGVQVLTASAKAATAGLTDTSTAARAIVGALNAYGEGADQARAVSDELFQTVNVGVLNFNDLAQGIGQVIGTAAAAHVPLKDVGAAIATMTRQGLVPAESFTSLNQILAQLIQPSKGLAQVFDQLGYESGASALKAKGLYGVMQDIRRATGGNITTMSELFTDTRALRGAMDLVANGGRTYANSQQQMGDASRGAGATQHTLSEQLKAVSAQWALLKNRTEAVAISLGRTLLPELNGLIHGVEAIAGVIAHDGVRQVVEFGAAIYGASLAVKGLRAIAGSEFIAQLGQMIGLHEANAAALTAEGAAATRAAAQYEELAVAEAAAGSTGGRRLSILPLLGSGLGRAGVVGTALFAVGQGINAIQRALNPPPDVDKLTNSLIELAASGRLVGELPKTFGAGLKDLGSEIRRVVDPSNFQRAGDVAGTIVHIGGLLGSAHPDLDEAHHDFDSLDKSLAGLVQSGHADAAKSIFSTLATTANRQGVATRDLSSVLPKYNQALADTAAQAKLAGISTDGMVSAQVKALAQIKAMRQEALKQARSTVLPAFLGAFDISSEFQPADAAKSVHDAQQELLDAQRALRQEEARTSAQSKESVSSDISLANARKRVTDATTALTKAQHDAAQTGDLATIYRKNERDANTFVTNINTAIEHGLDPGNITRLLQEGPRAASAELAALVQDHSGHLIALANSSEHALERISRAAVRQAQFARIAINAPKEDADRYARELPKALSLQTLVNNMPAPATGHWLAEQLGITPKQVRQIAQDFGITLSTWVQNTLDQHPVHVHANVQIPRGAQYHQQGYAAGGHVVGPGPTGVDSIPAMLAPGEFINPAAALRKLAA
jgi:TP901 family phage tail tape measure protein